MKITDTMVLFWRSNEVFSNWCPAKFTDGTLFFDNSEQYMMIRKAELMGDFDSSFKMQKVSDPRELKQLGRQVKNYNEELWIEHRLDVMIKGCYYKFSQNASMMQELLNTGERILVEASPNDKIWGIGLEEKDPRCLDQSQWQGQNLLGQALMVVRKRIQSEQT